MSDASNSSKEQVYRRALEQIAEGTNPPNHSPALSLHMSTDDMRMMARVALSAGARIPDETTSCRCPAEPGTDCPLTLDQCKARTAVETTPEPKFVNVGTVIGRDDSEDAEVLIDWVNESYEPKSGTMMFLRLWTEEEIAAAKREGERLGRALGLSEKSVVPHVMPTIAKEPQ
jgi:hypothetical protein